MAQDLLNIANLVSTKKENEEEPPKKKKGGGPCSQPSNDGDSSEDSAEYPSGGDPEKDLGEVGMVDVDDSVN